MDDYQINRMIRERTESRFRDGDTVKGAYGQKVPMSPEREYIRLTREYMGFLKEELDRELPGIKEAYRQQREQEKKEGMRTDGAADLMVALTQVFNQVKNQLIKKTGKFALRAKLDRIAAMSANLSTKGWKRLVRQTLGINILDDYYAGDFYEDMLQQWVSDNVDLISSLPENCLDRMKELIYEDWEKGLRSTEIAKDIQHEFQVTRKHARFIARDQMAKLNAQITRKQHEDAGVTEYVWSSSGDERVRESHRILDGHRFRYDDPPETDNGRRCNPGEDYNCRCIAVPVFDRSFTVPIDTSEEGNGYE